MPTRNVIERKIRNAEDLKSVVTIMKAAAASSIHRFEEAVEASSVYRRTLDHAFHALMRSPDAGEIRDLSAHRGSRVLLIFGAQQGMCGQFNETLLEYIQSRENLQDSDDLVFSVGDRIGSMLHQQQVHPTEKSALPHSIQGVRDLVRHLVSRLQILEKNRTIREISLYHHQKSTGASYNPVCVPVLPLDSRWLRSLAEETWESGCLPYIPESRQRMMSALTREHVYLALYRAAAESLASENASRLASMQAAEQNIDEQLDAWRSRYHRSRQNAVTGELLDITSGYEALRG